MSRLPSGSTARTWKTCTPPPSGPAIVCGEVQGANSPASSAHSNWFTGVPSSSSKPSNSKVALVSVVSSSGPSDDLGVRPGHVDDRPVPGGADRVDVPGGVDRLDDEGVLARRR